MSGAIPVHEPDRHAATAASVLDIFTVFTLIGVSSFGGGTQSIMHREIVERRRWLDDDAFLAGFAIAQVMPGANPVNLALYLGMKVCGAAGAIAAVLGMLAPAFCIVLLLGVLYAGLAGLPLAHFVLAGVAAAGVGVTMSVGVKLGAHAMRNAVQAGIALAVFIAVGLLKWPMVPVVAVAVPVSILVAYCAPHGRSR